MNGPSAFRFRAISSFTEWSITIWKVMASVLYCVILISIKRQESVRKNWKFMQRWSVISRNIWKAVMCLFGEMYDEVSPGKVDIMAYYDGSVPHVQREDCRYFMTEEMTFRKRIQISIQWQNMELISELHCSCRMCCRLRLDPGEAAGDWFLKNLYLKTGKEADFSSNWFSDRKRKILFWRRRSAVCNRESAKEYRQNFI